MLDGHPSTDCSAKPQNLNNQLELPAVLYNPGLSGLYQSASIKLLNASSFPVSSVNQLQDITLWALVGVVWLKCRLKTTAERIMLT